MSNKRNTAATLSLVSIFLLAGSLANADQTEKQSDLNNFLCKDIMRLSGTERDISIAFYHGYMLGKKGTTMYVRDKLSNISDQVIDYCLDNPNIKMLDAFIKVSQ
ncbi:MAG: HdeA/HdeB family chaperone [Amphritea sp.]